MSHTPGPWAKDIHDCRVWSVDTGKLIALPLGAEVFSVPEIEANALLIAAAPELLSSLKVLVKQVRKMRDTYGGIIGLVDDIVEAETIISKAEGER